jgi:hypothetical protein
MCGLERFMISKGVSPSDFQETIRAAKVRLPQMYLGDGVKEARAGRRLGGKPE